MEAVTAKLKVKTVSRRRQSIKSRMSQELQTYVSGATDVCLRSYRRTRRQTKILVIFWRFADRAASQVYLSQYLSNLMHKICFTISFISCLYMFRAHVLIIRRSKIALHSLWYHHTYRCIKLLKYWDKFVIYCVNCNWVATRWQQYSTHLHTNNTQNDTKQTIHRKTQKFWKSAGRAPSLQVLPWHLPYNWGKSKGKPQSG